MIARATLVSAASVLAGCGAGSQAGQAAAASMTDTVTVVGIVRMVGADPFAQLVVQAEGGEATALVGPLQSELNQTVGLEVRVTGVAADAVPPSRMALEVSSYETVALNGVPAHTGVLEQSDEGLRLVGESQGWMLVDPPDGLRTAVGAKAWVAGDASGGALRVTAFGILKRASSP
jgi:hypothetical protein